MVRFVVNADGKDLTKVLTFEKLNSLVKSVKMRTAVDLVRHARPEITKMIEKTDSKAEAQQADIVAAAITQMNHDQQVEMTRLTSLAEVNPNIRQDEIEHLQSSTESLAHYLENAQLKLDSLRVVIAV